MRLSVLFSVVLVLGLVAMCFEIVSSSRSGRKVKKEGKSKGPGSVDKPNRVSRGKMRKVWINLNSSLTYSPANSLYSPSLSISPWTYVASYDESRLPEKIFEAKCEKTGCMTRDGHEDTGLESRPVYYEILVLRRVKNKKKKKVYSLRLEKMTISVGCTCTLPTVLPQNR
ncbi:interleukin 17a/f3 [Hoplias malabaricus]|uniref:interleukin 17a/f3 n=1 Tax=Hoplias malabaricus TaxID=27720 RepID=UPI003461E49F